MLTGAYTAQWFKWGWPSTMQNVMEIKMLLKLQQIMFLNLKEASRYWEERPWSLYEHWQIVMRCLRCICKYKQLDSVLCRLFSQRKDLWKSNKGIWKWIGWGFLLFFSCSFTSVAAEELQWSTRGPFLTDHPACPRSVLIKNEETNSRMFSWGEQGKCSVLTCYQGSS